jgi:hypothetical protein
VGRLGYVLTATAAVCSLWAATAARADQTVVTATVYPGSQGSVSSPQVSASHLGNCPEYSGGGPLTLEPSGQPYQPPVTSWAVGTILTCALNIPQGNVDSVQVQSSSQGFENPLSSTQIFSSTAYQDPGAPGALPLISTDSTEDQNTYFRPYMGGSDANGRDEVVQSGAPVTIVVYETGAVLTVNASKQQVSAANGGVTEQFSATVTTSGGSTVPAPALTWSWDFGDGTAASSAAAPEHTFPAGSYFVTVQVTDNSTGAGGTATIPVTTPSSTTNGNSNHNGAGNNQHSHNPTGSTHGSPRVSGSHGEHRSSGTTTTQTSTTTTTTTTTSSTTTPSSTTPASTPATSPPPTAPTPTPAPTTSPAPHRLTARPPRPRVTRIKPTPAPATNPRAPLVSGRLIADVVPLPLGASALARTGGGASPQVRRATDTTALGGIAAGLAVLLLLGLGAGSEWQGRPLVRLPRFLG